MRGVWVAAVVIALAGCGTGDSSSNSGGETLPNALPIDAGVIEVSSDSELAAMLGPETPAELFVAAPELEYPAGSAVRWEMAIDPPTEDEVRRLAELVGVAGDVTDLEDGLGGGLQVGTPQADGGWLAVRSFGEPTWNLARSDDALVEAGAIPCPTLAFDDPNAGQCANGANPSAAQPADAADVESTVAAVMAGLGVPVDGYRIETFVYGSVTEVAIEFSPGGQRTDVTWSLSVSGTGELLSGWGPLRSPLAVDEVATVGLDEALLRLSRVSPGVPVNTVPPPTTMMLAAPVSTGASSDPAITSPPVPVDQGPVVLPTITGVEAGLVSVWDIANRKWLVPALVVTGEFGFTTSVPVISAEMVRVVDAGLVETPVRTGPPLTVPAPPPTIAVPVPTGQSQTTLSTTTDFATPPPATAPRTTPAPNGSVVEPLPTLPVPPEPDTPPSEIPAFYSEVLNEILVGQPLDGAWTRLLEAGWDVRVDDLDDPTETFTADLSVGRVTIQHRGGIVTGISVG